MPVIAVGLFVAIHFLPLRATETFPYFWGVHFTSLIGAVPVILAVSVALIYALAVRFLDFDLTGVHHPVLAQFLIPLPGILLFIALLVTFGQKAALLGDGYMIVTEIRDFVAHGYRHSQFANVISRQFLSVEAAAVGMKLFGESLPRELVSVYRWIGVLAGAVYISAAAMLIHRYARTMRDVLVGWGLILSIPVVMLFLGYLENYALVAAWTLLYLVLVVTHAEGKWTPLIAGLMLGIGVALHVVFIALIPAHIRYLLRQSRKRGKADWMLALVPPAVYCFLILLCGVPWSSVADIWNPAVMIDRHMVGILQPNRDLGVYGIFSFWHAIDLLNLLLFAAPAAGVALVIRRVRSVPDRKGAHESFLAWAAGGSLLLVLFFNSDIGMSFDWDILSVLLLPISLYAIVKILDLGTGSRTGFFMPSLVFALLFHQIVWLTTASSDDPMVTRTELMALSSRMTPAAGREAAVRNLGWYYTDRNTPQLTERLYLQYLQRYPDSRIRSALAGFYEKSGRLQASIEQLRMVVENEGYHYFEYAKLGELYSRLEQPDSAIQYLQRALEAKRSAQVLGLLGYSYAVKKELDSADAYADRAVVTEPTHYIGYYIKGLVAQERRDTVTVLRMCEKILASADVPPDIRASVEASYARMRR